MLHSLKAVSVTVIKQIDDRPSYDRKLKRYFQCIRWIAQTQPKPERFRARYRNK